MKKKRNERKIALLNKGVDLINIPGNAFPAHSTQYLHINQ